MALSFMFDDGEPSVYTAILPLFEKYGYKASISVIPGQVALMPGNPERGSWSQWKDAATRGFEIANHSMNHRDAQTLKPEDFKLEIDDAKAMIEKNANTKVTSYVFPLDIFVPVVVKHVIRTHPAARDPEYLRSFYDRSLDIMYGGKRFSVGTANRLVDMGISRHLWLIAECHGLDVGDRNSYKPLTADFLDRHLLYVRTHSPDVWVDTFGKIFEYLSLRKGTEVVRKELGDGQAQVIMHNPAVKELPRPLTVVLKVQGEGIDVNFITAQTPDGGSLKAWACGDNSLCVNIPSYDCPVRVAWKSSKL